MAIFSKASIKSLLEPFEGSLELTSNEFSKGDIKGRYSKNNLYITQADLVKTNETEPFKFDKKASASIVLFKANSKVESITDIYFTSGEKTNFITYNEAIEQGNQIKDEIIFGRIISSKIDNYHFTERDYSATIDPVVKDGAMSKWMLNGFVTLTLNGKKALISDYILGQDPILILNDINQTVDATSFTNPLTSDFPSKGKKYFAKYLDDLVVFSEDETTCDALIADFKLGNINKSQNNLISDILGGKRISIVKYFNSALLSNTKLILVSGFSETPTFFFNFFI